MPADAGRQTAARVAATRPGYTHDVFILRRFIKQAIVVFVVGFVVRRLLESSNPRAKRIGEIANRFVGSGRMARPSRRLGARRRAVARA